MARLSANARASLHTRHIILNAGAVQAQVMVSDRPEVIEPDPLLAEGMALGAVITPCDPRPEPIVSIPVLSTAIEQPPQSNQIAGDVELLRIAIGLKQSSEARLWLVMLQIARESNINHFDRDTLESALRRAGVSFCARTLTRWLRRGHGLYWRLTTTARIWFIGYERVAAELYRRALRFGLPDLVSTNLPGRMAYVYITVSGSIGQFEAAVYAGWLAARNNPTISRYTLSLLFNRKADALREWERAAGIDVLPTFIQYHETFIDQAPDHAVVYTALVNGKHRERRCGARGSNSYRAPIVRQQNRRGRTRRVLRVMRDLQLSLEPDGFCEQRADVQTSARVGLHPTGRLYFNNHKHAQRSYKHTTKDRARYVTLRTTDGATIQEYSPDGRPRIGSRDIILTNRRERSLKLGELCA